MEDIGETDNLARKLPEEVRQLDSLIDKFVKETGALYPRPNPAYTATANTTDATDGLVPRSCKLVEADGAIQVVADGRLPYLGTAGVKLNGPLKLTLVAQIDSAGQGRVHWKTNDQDNFPGAGQSVKYVLSAGESWQEVTVNLPIQGRLQVVRLYLPADKPPVELRLIHFQDAQGREKAWDFSNVSP